MAGKRALIYNVGVNDSDYLTFKRLVKNGKTVFWVCPYYDKWKSILARCYSNKVQLKQPSYIGCKVCEEWLIFSNFKNWMEKRDWKGKHLDKDILLTGNKVYCPDACIFVEPVVNMFLIGRNHKGPDSLIGAHFSKRDRKFTAYCSNPFTKKREWLGYFETQRQAHLSWKSRKHDLACALADSEYVTDERVAQALRNRFK
jgi:hypothetical protein